MAPLLFALALILQDAPAATPPSDGPMATAVPRKQDVAALPIQGGAVSAPTDDYGYVGWCAGAIASYVDLYDRAMPEVTRIERAWPTPSTEENISKVYPEQREEAKRNLALFARAMQAAEQASPTPIQTQGEAAVRRGRAVWTGATSVPKAQLAQFWMSWSPPAKCEETAKALEARSRLFGQALSARGPVTAPPPPPPEEPAPEMLLARPSAAPAATLTAPAPEATPAEVETLPPVAPEAAPEAAPSEVAAPDVAMPEVAVPDAAALSAGAPDGVLSMTPVPVEDSDDATPTAEPSATAIDALLPDPKPVAEPAPAPAPVAKPAPPAATPAPAKPRRYKKGLRETLGGLRGTQ